MASDNATAFSGGGSTFLSDPGIYLAHPDGNVSSEMVTNLTNVSGVESWSPGPAKHPRWMMAPPSAMTPDILTLITIREHLDKTIPYFLSLGILGNIVAACTFLLTPLKKNSLSHYLTALAIADIINLAACMVTWLSKQGLELYTKVGVCQVTSFALLMSRLVHRQFSYVQ
ncbi:hypothetical protein BaRGS_00005589 [Batillaria attramentaria]|uniref:G-protein coupled receptors family 1 profile domain-containing protein n=1 Tax=Batillaria attramentaria TaxID=370345 RepID=A0ABD0LUQ3_9CAEN